MGHAGEGVERGEPGAGQRTIVGRVEDVGLEADIEPKIVFYELESGQVVE